MIDSLIKISKVSPVSDNWLIRWRSSVPTVRKKIAITFDTLPVQPPLNPLHARSCSADFILGPTIITGLLAFTAAVYVPHRRALSDLKVATQEGIYCIWPKCQFYFLVPWRLILYIHHRTVRERCKYNISMKIYCSESIREEGRLIYLEDLDMDF